MTRSPLRIELVVPALPPAGMEMVVGRLARSLSHRGYDVGITCIEYIGALGEQLRSEGVTVTLVPTPGITTLLYPAPLVDWFRRRAPDVVHVHSGAWLKAARAAALAGVPRVVHTVHGLLDREPWHGRILMRCAARYTAAITAVSEPLLTHLRDVVRLLPSQLHLVPNGIDTGSFAPGPQIGGLRAALGIGADRFVIGNVARFSPVKNHALLVDAFAELIARRPHVYLVLVGEGELRPAIEEQVRALNLSQDVGFYGAAVDVSSVYRDFDAFVLSSLAEGTSMSLLEAMASGVCVVATAVGGNPDLLAHGKAGILTPSGDVARLAQALEQVVCNADLRTGLAHAGRARVVDCYAETEVISRYESLYHGSRMTPHSNTKGITPCVE